MNNYKINGVNMINFKGIAKANVEINGESKYLLGTNGAGKTTVIDAIVMAIKGTIQKSNGKPLLKKDRYLLVGEHGNRSNIELILKEVETNKEIVITRVFDRNKNDLIIRYKDGGNVDDSFLDSLLSEFSINPVSFLSKTPQEQAILLGIDTSKYDEIIANEKIELQVRNKSKLDKMDALRTMNEVKPTVKVNIAKLYEELSDAKQEQQKHHQLNELIAEQSKLQKENASLEGKEKIQKINIDWLYGELEKSNRNEELKRERKALLAEISETEEMIKSYQEKLRVLKEKQTDLPVIDGNVHSPEVIKSKIVTTQKHNILAEEYEKKQLRVAQNKERITELENKIRAIKFNNDQKTVEQVQTEINGATEQNKLANNYENYLKIQQEVETAKSYWKEQEEKISDIIREKIDYVSSLKLPLPELGINEQGGLVYNGKEIDEVNFNHAKMVNIAVALLSHSAPKLKTIFIKDGNLYDEKTIKDLEDKGFQMIYEFVDVGRPKDNVIVIKEIIENNTEETETLPF